MNVSFGGGADVSTPDWKCGGTLLPVIDDPTMA